MPPVTAHLVSHTHWDRAWYLPFQRFRVHLVALVDGLLDLLEGEPRFRSFTLDGQMALLDDYLAVRPENRERIQALVAAGRLEIGPWFVLPDAFLPSGESLIRNLELGLRKARALGADPKDGYMPDSFGHIGEMPQILLGFGLRSFLFMRGMPAAAWQEHGCEFTWRAPDGSEVLAIYLRESYLDSSALGLPDAFGDFEGIAAEAKAAARRIARSLADRLERTPSGVHLLMNGCDHMPVQGELPELLEELIPLLDGVELQHTSIARHVDAVLQSGADHGVYAGELLGNAHHPVLSSVWSTRLPLKQANHAAERALLDHAEPLCCLAGAAGGRFRSLLEEAWRLLLLNHAHDDICGCSVDEVHREDLVRFAEVEQIAGEVADECVRELARRAGAMQQPGVVWLSVWQPDRTGAAGIAEAEVFLPAAKESYVQDTGEDPAAPGGRPVPSAHPDARSLDLRDPQGQPVPVQVLLREDGAFRARHIDTGAGTRFRIAFPLPAAAGSGLAWWRVTASPRPGAIPSFTPTSAAVEFANGDWRITVHPDGRIDLAHRGTGVVLTDALALVDDVDAGDTYSFSPRPMVPASTTREQMPERVEALTDGPVFQGARIHWRLTRPGGLDAPAPVTLPLTLELRLPVAGGDPQCSVEVDNTVRDHRLRLHVATGDSPPEWAWAGAAFGFTRRERGLEQQPTPPAGYPGERTYPTLFSRDLLVVPDAGNIDRDGKAARGELAIAHPGLHEFQLLGGAGSRPEVALTLLRCVGMLSRGDGLWRRCQAGPSLPTPEAQCPGRHRVRLALAVLPPGSEPAVAAARLRAHVRPPRVAEARLLPAGGSATGSPLRGGAEAVQLSDPAVEVRVCRALPDGAFLLRLVNRSPNPRTVTVTPGPALLAGRQIAAVRAADLGGNPGAHLPAAGDRWTVALRGHGVATLHCAPEQPAR